MTHERVSAITDNLESALRAQGINFTRAGYAGHESVPAGLIPLGQVFYNGEDFEASHGQRPLYAEAKFTVRVILNEKDAPDMVRSQQRWVHAARAAITVDSLNTGALSLEKPVSMVAVKSAEAENAEDNSAIMLRVSIRYREG